MELWFAHSAFRFVCLFSHSGGAKASGTALLCATQRGTARRLSGQSPEHSAVVSADISAPEQSLGRDHAVGIGRLQAPCDVAEAARTASIPQPCRVYHGAASATLSISRRFGPRWRTMRGGNGAARVSQAKPRAAMPSAPVDVAVGEHRHAHGRADGADRIPVGRRDFRPLVFPAEADRRQRAQCRRARRRAAVGGY